MKNIDELLARLRALQINLWAEGNDLRFRAPAGALTAALRTELSAHKPAILQYLHQTLGEKASDTGTISVLPQQQYYALSHGQQRLLILDQLETGITTHNMFTSHLMTGRLDRKALDQAFAAVIRRHEILRTSFVMKNNEAVQQVHRPEDIDFRIAFIDGRHDPDMRQKIDEMAEDELILRFDLSKAPLFRIRLMQTADDQYVFFLTLHHIISDGWSQEVLLKDVVALYNAYKEGLPDPLPALRIQYKEYASWLNEQLRGAGREEYESYWLGRFRQAPPVLDLPLDFSRPEKKAPLAMAHVFRIEGEEVDALRQFSRDHNITLFMFFFAVLKTVLYRYTGLEDITVGVPVACRTHPELGGQIGFYVNTLAVRTQFSGHGRFLDLLYSIRDNSEAAFKYQLYPFDLLVEKLPFKRDLSRHPLFDILYTYENARDRKKQMVLSDLRIEALPVGHCMDKFDIELTVIDEREDLLECVINYNTSLFRKDTVAQLGHHLRLVTSLALRDGGCALVDFALDDERVRLTNRAFLQSRAFWEGQLKKINAGEWGRIIPSPVQDARISHTLSLPADICRQLHKATGDAPLAAGIYMLTVFQLLLYKYTGARQLSVGVPAFGGNAHDGDKPVNGFLPVCTELSADLAFRELLSVTQATLHDVMLHKNYPLDLLLAGDGHLYDAVFVAEGFPVRGPLPVRQPVMLFSVLPAGAGVEPAAGIELPAGMDIESAGAGMMLKIDHQPLLAFDIDHFLHHYLYILETVLADAGIQVRDLALPVIHPENKATARMDDLRVGTTVISLWKELADRKPANSAIQYDNEIVTYEEADDLSDRMAGILVSRYDIRSGDKVAVLTEPSHLLPVILLAVFKTGAAYVPLDPHHPAARNEYIMEDTAISLLITDGSLSAGDLSGLPVLSIANAGTFREEIRSFPRYTLTADLSPASPAYIIYTSGSTGKPKGVIVSHGNFGYFLLNLKRSFPLDDSVVMPLLASHTFDISLFQIFLPLLFNGKLLVLSRETVTNNQQLPGILEQVTAIDAVPAFFSHVIEQVRGEGDRALWDEGSRAVRGEGGLRHVKNIFIGGDNVPDKVLEDLRQVFPEADIAVTYGPTEATIFCSAIVYFPHTSMRMQGAVIGRPLPGIDIHIMDTDGHRCPQGVTGEICIAGPGVAQGYCNNIGLTAEKFTEDPLHAGQRMYRTGDLGRLLAGDLIGFGGRRDNQVKIRGFRIETGEIERVLARHPAIEQNVVIARTDQQGNKYLAAYVTSVGQADIPGIRNFLEQALPVYMVPAVFVQLERLPLTFNGKVDIQNLPDPSTLTVNDDKYEAPVSTLEKELVRIWEDILGRDRIGIRDNFFEMGGHSLKAARVASHIGKDLRYKIGVRQLFEYPNIAALAKFLAGIPVGQVNTEITSVGLRPFYEISDAQRRLWILSQLEAGSVAYNTPGAFLIEGRMDVAAFCKAIESAVQRHESLRTVFPVVDDHPVQQILTFGEMNFKVEVIDSRDKGEGDLRGKKEEALERAVQITRQQAAMPFDLAAGPLIRVSLLLVGDDSQVLIFNLHHIINDGWSQEVLVKEVLQLYHALINELRNPLSPLRIQYKDFAVWQNARLRTAEGEVYRRYWLEQLQGELPVLELPADHPRPVVQTYRGALERFVLPAEMAAGINLFARKNDVTLFMVLLAATKVLLYKYSGQTDIILGTPIAGRDQAGLEDQIGFYVNTLALRTRIDPEAGFASLLSLIRSVTLGASEHQSYPFDRLVEELKVRKDLSRSPVFDVLFTVDHPTISEKDWMTSGGLRIRSLISDFHISKFDLTIRFTENGDRLDGSIEYNTDLFDRGRILRMKDHLQVLLGAILSMPDCPVRSLPYLTQEEYRLVTEALSHTDGQIEKMDSVGQIEKVRSVGQIEKVRSTGQIESGDTDREGPGEKTILDMFRQQVMIHSDRMAVACKDKTLSYGELDKLSAQVANMLALEHSVGAGDRIGVMVYRSEWLPVLLLGILRAGAVYVPVDPDYPVERINYLLADSRSKLLVAQKEIETAASGNRPSIWLEELIERLPGMSPVCERVVGPASPAYVIYTSGSTGDPKGVVIGHDNLYAFMEWARHEFGQTSFGVLYAATSYCFDLSVFELFYPLVAGKTVRILESPAGIGEWLDKEPHKVLLNTVPSVMDLLLREGLSFGKIAAINIAGEPVPTDFRQRIPFEQVEVRNLYGPSETTTYSTCYRFTGDHQQVPIGRPIANTRIYLLDAGGLPVPAGNPGEIYISGAGVAQGYLYRTALTEEKFTADPFMPGLRMYRTGDMGKWLEDGNLQFLGRKDSQVKIRGYRIEPGEIEACLETCPGVKKAVVLAAENEEGEKYITAYLEAEGVSLSIEAVRDFLGQRIPRYMFPDHYVMLDALPLTPNGKIDKRKLSLTAVTDGVLSAGTHIMPASAMEKRLAAIWTNILGLASPGVTEDFFMLGGSSLKAIRVLSAIRRETGHSPDLRQFFLHPTIRSLAQHMDREEQASYLPIKALPAREWYELSAAQARLWILSTLNREANIAYNMAFVYAVEGSLDKTLLRHCLQIIMERHEVLRTVIRTFDGHPGQQILAGPALPYREINMGNISREAAIDRIREEIRTPFDLENGPLFTVLLAETGRDRYFLLFQIHHIICDGWSLKILMEELFELYRSMREGSHVAKAPLAFHYKDYAHWQNELLASDHELKRYWLQVLSPEWPRLNLSGGVAEVRQPLHRAAGLEKRRVASGTLSQLQAIGRESDCTLFMVLAAGVYVLLYSYTGYTDILIGTPIANREKADLEDQLGLYLNMLPLRTDFSPDDTFASLLEKVRAVSREAYQHQEYPFDKMVDDLRSAGRTIVDGLFNVVIDMVDFYQADHDHYTIEEGLNIRLEPIDEQFSRFDLTIYFNLKESYLEIAFEYNTGLYKPVQIQKMANRFANLLRIIPEYYKERRLRDIPMGEKPVLPAIVSAKTLK